MSDFLSFCGTTLSLALYGSALYGVVTKGRTKSASGGNTLAGCSPTPYIALLVSCLLWTQYSILINDSALTTINSVGVVFSFASTAAFYKFTDQRERTEVSMLRGLACLYPALLWVRYRGGPAAQAELGLACAICSLFMIVSPLGVLPQVMKSRSTALLSFPLAICSFMSCVVWTFYGLRLLDPYIIMPNMIGGVASLVQLALFAVYGRSDGLPPRASYSALPTTDSTMEKYGYDV